MCTNSIGSSIVRMWSCRSVLILSIMAASVVDLPDPVGPVTSTKPRGLSHSLLTTAGSPSWLKDLISNGMSRNTAEVAPRRSEEHTSELQSHSDLVCRLLLE